ncbi:MAG: hypothetical protein KDD69_11790 [Bdellovibrionales bacterium]|nr:hypothetical protein [Bdellovibrionales bacterium]
MTSFIVILHDADPATSEGRERLKQNLRSQLGLETDRIEAIFASLPVILKEHLEQGDAESYVRVLEKLGATAEALPQASSMNETNPAAATADPLPASADNLAFTEDLPPAAKENAPTSGDYSMEELEDMLAEALAEEVDSDEDELGLTPKPEAAPKPESDGGLDFVLDESLLTGSIGIGSEKKVEATAEEFPDELILAPEPTVTNAPTEFERMLETLPGEQPSEDDDYDLDLSELDQSESLAEYAVEPVVRQPPSVPQVTIPPRAQDDDDSLSVDPEHEDELLRVLEATVQEQPQRSAHLPLHSTASATPPLAAPPVASPLPPPSPPPSHPVLSEHDETPGPHAVAGNSILFASTATIWIGMAVVLIGLAVLLLRPMLMPGFGPEPSVQFTASPEMIEALLKQQEEILRTQSVPSGAKGPSTVARWSAESAAGELTFDLSVLTVNDTPAFMELKLHTPRPAELTAEELVAGVSRPWVERLVASKLRVAEDQEDAAGSIRLSGPGRAYIEDRGYRGRLVVEVTATLDKAADGRLDGSFRAELGDPLKQYPALAEDDQVVYVEHIKEGGFRLFIQAPFRATPVAPSAAEVEPVKGAPEQSNGSAAAKGRSSDPQPEKPARE